jgi:hypothetical protein
MSRYQDLCYDHNINPIYGLVDNSKFLKVRKKLKIPHSPLLMQLIIILLFFE